jgi:hypothetical protein
VTADAVGAAETDVSFLRSCIPMPSHEMQASADPDVADAQGADDGLDAIIAGLDKSASGRRRAFLNRL